MPTTSSRTPGPKLDAVLVDTHALLWFVFDAPDLSETAAATLSDPQVEKVLSVASLWEIGIKVGLGKLSLGMSYERFVGDFVVNREVSLLGLDVGHLIRNSELPFHHRDPFDRLLAAQALVENLVLVTRDPSFVPYGVRTLW